MFTDSHCHLFNEYYDNLDEIIKHAKEKNINKFITAACDYKTSLETIETVKKYDNVYGCVGLHPEEVEDNFDYDIFNNLPKKIIAIGEIGLDYYYTKDNKDKQIEIFEKQLSIAEKLNLPVVIHSREATQDTIDILKKYNVKGVIHSFSGSYETACIYLKMGYKLGVNGVVTFKNCNIKDVYKKLTPQDIILETDSPYLAPVPYRGKQNEPAYEIETAKFMAEIFNISLQELAEITNENIHDIFDI